MSIREVSTAEQVKEFPVYLGEGTAQRASGSGPSLKNNVMDFMERISSGISVRSCCVQHPATFGEIGNRYTLTSQNTWS